MIHRAERVRRVALTGTAIALCLAAAVAIAIVVSGDPDHTETQLASTAVVLLLFGAAATAGISILDGSRVAVLGWVCIAVALAGFVVATVTIWTTPENDDSPAGLVKAFGALLVSALALADLSLLARRTGEGGRRGRVVVVITQVAAVLLAGMLVVAILAEVTDETYFRWVGAAAILWVLGTALVPIARRAGLS